MSTFDFWLFLRLFFTEVCQLNMHLDVVIFTGKYHSLITEQIAALIVVGVLPVNHPHCAAPAVRKVERKYTV